MDQRPDCSFALKALENHLSGDRLAAFVVQCREDYKVLRAFADEKRLAVTIHNAFQHADAESSNSKRDLTITEEWRKRGVVCALDQVRCHPHPHPHRARLTRRAPCRRP